MSDAFPKLLGTRQREATAEMFWRKKRAWEDVREEIDSHLRLDRDALRETGETDAERAARQAFGNVVAFQEAFYERGRCLWWDHFVRDLRHALRLMRRKPGFSTAVVLTLALGIGANAAIFSLIHAVLLRALPYRDPGQLAMLWSDDPVRNEHEGLVSLLNFEDWKKQSRTFQDLTLYRPQTFLFATDGPPERLRSARVMANFFPLLGAQPTMGRLFSADEEKRGERVVVLSHGFWQRQFGGSAQAIGSVLLMDGRASRIIGVMPPGFQFPFADTQVWEPITAHPYWSARDRSSPRSADVWYVLGRIQRNANWGEAQAEMSAIARRLAAAYPESKSAPDVGVVPLAQQTTGKVRRSLSILFGAVFLMLLIACINVANLLLAHGSVREREFAVRRALGAGRLRVAGQLLTETVVFSAAGGLLGLMLAAAGLRALIAFGPRDIPRLGEARIDLQVLLFTLSISLFSAITSGLWPAIHGDTTRVRSRQWTTLANRGLRNLLVAGEVSLALVLLTGAGLLVHSFLRLQTVDPGFHPESLLVMHIDLHVGKNAAQRVAYFHEAVERAQAMPGVRSAAAISRFLKSEPENRITIEGRPAAWSNRLVEVADDVVTGPYFQTAGVALRKGRFFSDQDRHDSPPVAIINQAMAGIFWPGEDPIGKQFSFADGEAARWITVVGVSGDARRQGIEKEAAPQMFRPHSQNPDNEMDLLVRAASDPGIIAAAVRSEIQSIDRSVPKFGLTTVQQQLGEQSAERRFHTSLIGLFSLIALFLATIGIYGLMHHSVVQRTHEIGVRMALGARYGNVLAMILRQGLTLTGVGILMGTSAALGLTRMLASLLYGVTPTDPVTFVITPAILFGVAALACWLPARSAARIDPVLALRQD